MGLTPLLSLWAERAAKELVSTYRKRLLDAGVIEEGLDGTFSFALPGFGEYVNQRFR